MESEKFYIYGNSKEYVKKLIEAMIKHSKSKDTDKVYWIAQWSWTPISDGYCPSQTTIDVLNIVNGIEIYSSTKNYRKYFAYQLCENEEDAQKLCDIMNSFGYDYDIIASEILNALN